MDNIKDVFESYRESSLHKEKLANLLKDVGISTEKVEYDKGLGFMPQGFIMETLQTLKPGEACEIGPNALIVDSQGQCWLEPNAEIFREIPADIDDTMFDCLRVHYTENGHEISFLNTIQYKWKRQGETYLIDDEQYRNFSNDPKLIRVNAIHVVIPKTSS